MNYIPYQGTPTRHAFYLVRKLCNAEWLHKPLSAPPEIIRHRAKPLIYGNKRLASYGYDKHMAFPPCFDIALGCGEPEYVKSTGQYSISSGIASLPGIWHLETGEWQWSPQARQHSIPVIEGYCWPEKHHVLKPFYEYLRWWHNESEPGSPARRLIKETYTTFLGLLAHKPETEQPGYLYAPDWRCMIISEARQRIEGQIEKVRLLEDKEPVAVKIDALYYKEQVFCLLLGENIGNFREVKLC